MPPVPTQFPEHESIEVYGRRAEFEAARANDPIPKFRAKLNRENVLTEVAASKINDEARAEMEDAVQFALASPFPAPEEAMNYVYA